MSLVKFQSSYPGLLTSSAGDPSFIGRPIPMMNIAPYLLSGAFLSREHQRLGIRREDLEMLKRGERMPGYF